MSFATFKNSRPARRNLPSATTAWSSNWAASLTRLSRTSPRSAPSCGIRRAVEVPIGGPVSDGALARFRRFGLHPSQPSLRCWSAGRGIEPLAAVRFPEPGAVTNLSAPLVKCEAAQPGGPAPPSKLDAAEPLDLPIPDLLRDQHELAVAFDRDQPGLGCAVALRAA